MTATGSLPRALKGAILGLLGAALAPATVLWLFASVSALVSEGAFTFESLLVAGSKESFIFAAVAFVAGWHALIFGLPAFVVLNAFNKAGWVTALAGGFVIGALPVSILTWPHSPVGWTGQWSNYAYAALSFGGCGLCGGAAFWFLWTRFGAQPSSSG